MDRLFLILGSILALTAVAAGAFAAHALETRVEPDRLDTFRLAAQYQMYHALGLVAVAWAATRWPGSAVGVAGWAFVLGIAIFCGTLYAIGLGGPRWLGAVTPIGGLAFMAGWASLAWSAWRV